MRHGGVFLIALAFLGACDLTTFRQRVQRPAQIRVSLTDSVNFVVPDTVAVSTNFSVSVTSFGGGCETQGPTDFVTLSDGTAQLHPFDITETGEVACTRELKTFTHAATLQFGTAGLTSITVFGRDADGSNMSRTRGVFVK